MRRIYIVIGYSLWYLVMSIVIGGGILKLLFITTPLNICYDIHDRIKSRFCSDDELKLMIDKTTLDRNSFPKFPKCRKTKEICIYAIMKRYTNIKYIDLYMVDADIMWAVLRSSYYDDSIFYNSYQDKTIALKMLEVLIEKKLLTPDLVKYIATECKKGVLYLPENMLTQELWDEALKYRRVSIEDVPEKYRHKED